MEQQKTLKRYEVFVLNGGALPVVNAVSEIVVTDDGIEIDRHEHIDIVYFAEALTIFNNMQIYAEME